MTVERNPLTHRIQPGEAESAYTLLMAFDGGVTASVTTLSGGSVLTQLKGLYPQQKNISAGELPALIMPKQMTHVDQAVEATPRALGCAAADVDFYSRSFVLM